MTLEGLVRDRTALQCLAEHAVHELGLEPIGLPGHGVVDVTAGVADELLQQLDGRRGSEQTNCLLRRPLCQQSARGSPK